MSPKYNKHVQLWKSNHRCTRILLEIFVYDRVMTARCCGCSRALELGKELVEKWEKMGIKERKEEKKHCRPADVASLQCHPLPRCWHASIVVTMRGFIQTRLLPCHTSASLFMHAVCTALITPPRVSHITFKTQRSISEIQPRPAY